MKLASPANDPAPAHDVPEEPLAGQGWPRHCVSRGTGGAVGRARRAR
jgi:hypothetical protein